METAIEKLLNERYYLETESKWEHLAKRVSHIYPPIFDFINEKAFIPSTPTLMNANTNGQRKGTLSSCFTMGIEDSIEGIFDSVKETAIVTKASGGVGYDFSKLRSSKELVKSLNRHSSGPIPFMRIFNSTLDGIQQGGVRRGAGMGQILISHPDILDVIRLKNTKGEMERLNLSVRVTDEFYNKLEIDPNSPHIVYDSDNVGFELVDNGKVITVKNLWDEIVEYAWRCAEPGIFNIDIAHRQCTVTNIDDTVLSNPCSEYVSIPYSSCNLGSLNVTKFVKDGNFDWDGFHLGIRNATTFLNNVLDVNDFPIPKIKEVTLKVRPIGLGIMGLAHLFIKLGIPYNSEEALDFTNKLFFDLTTISMDESVNLAIECGEPYPAYDRDLYLKANERFLQYAPKLKEKISRYGIRNSCSTSQAPTGSIAYIANVSSGIEPLFALTYSRKIEKLNKEYEVVFISDPLFDEYLNANFDSETKIKILKQVADAKGSCQKVKEIPDEYKKIFVIASDLTPMEHLNLLAKVSNNISTSVSKTINLDSTATRDEISEVYLKAHALGIIGVTVYRDGCREGVLVHNVSEDNKEKIVKTNAPKRPKSLPCHVYRMSIINRETKKGEKWIAFIGLLDNDPYEIMAGKIGDIDFDSKITEGEMVKARKEGRKVYQFVHNGEVLVDDIKSAYLTNMREYVTRLMSLALRHGASIDYLKDVLAKSDGTIVDFNKSVIRAVKKYTKDVESKEKCPICNSSLMYVEGCVKCSNVECYYSKCG